MVYFSDAHIRTIIEANKNNKLAIFVGAGLSKLCESESVRAPSWSDLIDSLKSDFDSKIEETDFLKIAQLYYIEFGEHQYYQKIKSLFPEGLEPSSTHANIFKLNPQYVITTNWDDVLEKVIREQGLVYDVVVSDMDLVKVKLPRMLIKMHGDFQHHNIIFKEDDYLKYSFIFPLIENYLKGILSTHVVVFIGYSYSDVDLKMILKWVDSHSKVSPPKFLLKPTKTIVEEKYLKNHGITILSPISSSVVDYYQMYESFFNAINDPNQIDRNIKLIAEKFLENKEVFLQEKDNVLNYMFRKVDGLKDGLNEFNCLFPEQIKKNFTNCTVAYHVGCFGLDFHSEIMTYDYNKLVRAVYEIFFQSLYNDDFLYRNRAVLSKFFGILWKANCVFIKNKNYFNIKDLLEKINDLEVAKNGRCGFAKIILDSNLHRNDDFNKFLRFSSKDYLEISIAKKDYLNVLKNIETIIASSLRQRMYFKATINMFNYDEIVDLIERDDFFKRSDKSSLTLTYVKYDYKNRLKSLPPYISDGVEFLEEFLSFKYIYKEFYKLTLDAADKRDRVASRLAGGFSYNRDETRPELVFEQFLKFIYFNGVCISFYKEAKDFFSSYIEHKFNIQTLEKKISLLPIDGFVFIRYLKPDKAWKMIVKILNSKELDLFFDFSQDFGCYIYETFFNVTDIYLKNENFHYFYSDNISEWVRNVILLSALNKWSPEKLEAIVSRLAEIIDCKKATISFYENVDNFIVCNYKIYRSDLGDFAILMDSILKRIASDNLNALESRAFESYIDNFYNAISSSEYKYSNNILIENAIYSIRGASDKVKAFYIENIFLKLYLVSNQEVREKIKYFIDGVKSEELAIEESIFFKLNLMQHDFPVGGVFVEELKNWLLNIFDKQKMIDINFIKLGGVDYLLGLLDFLVNQKEIKELDECLNIFKSKLDEAKEQA